MQNIYRRSPLMEACSQKRVGVAQYLAGLRNINLDAEDIDGNTTIILCAQNGLDTVLKALLKRVTKDNLNSRNLKGNTALVVAAIHKKDKIMASLLRAGANGRLKNNDKKTWSSYIKEDRHERIMKMVKPDSSAIKIDSAGGHGSRSPYKKKVEAVVKLEDLKLKEDVTSVKDKTERDARFEVRVQRDGSPAHL